MQQDSLLVEPTHRVCLGRNLFDIPMRGAKLSLTWGSRKARTFAGGACLSFYKCAAAPNTKMPTRIPTSVGLDFFQLSEQLWQLVFFVEINRTLVLHFVSEITVPEHERYATKVSGPSVA